MITSISIIEDDKDTRAVRCSGCLRYFEAWQLAEGWCWECEQAAAEEYAENQAADPGGEDEGGEPW